MSKLSYRPDIDGLRAIAVLLVLVFHFDLFSVGKAGFIGVDVFFVISGYLITAIIAAEMAEGQFRFGHFLYRRVRRLYPALLVTLTLFLVAGYLLLLPHDFRELATETLYSLLYVINFYLWQNVDYFGLRAEYVPLLHMWSLAVEEQFYVVFPLFVWITYRIWKTGLFWVVLAATLASFALGVVFTPLKPEASFYLLPTRAWELMLGALLALALRQWGRPSDRVVALAGPIGLGLIALAVLLYNPGTLIPGWFALLPTVGAVALICGGFAVRAPVTRLLSSAPMVWIGRISYPLYLVHWPVRILLLHHVPEMSLGWRLAGFGLSFVLAAAIYYLVETPIRTGRVLGNARGYMAVAVVMTLSLLGTSAWVRGGDGLPGRFDPEVARILEIRDDIPVDYLPCEYRGGGLDRACAIGDAAAARSVLVIGDSHGVHFAPGLDLWLAERGRAGVLAFHHGCLPVLGGGDRYCARFVADIIAALEAEPEIEEVVLVSIWRQALPEGGKPLDGRWVPEDEVTDVFSGLLAETVEELTGAGRRVTIVEPLFAAPRNVPVTRASNIAFGRDRDVTRMRADYEATFAPIFGAFETVEGPDVVRVSLLSRFCAEELCVPDVEGTPLFTDNNHIAIRHSPLLADVLLREMPF